MKNEVVIQIWESTLEEVYVSHPDLEVEIFEFDSMAERDEHQDSQRERFRESIKGLVRGENTTHYITNQEL